MYMIIEKMRLKVNGWFSKSEDLKVKKLEKSIEV